jgi:hypothetical protein
VGAAAGAIGAATGPGVAALTHGLLPAGAAACKCSVSTVVVSQIASSYRTTLLPTAWQQQV